MAKSKPRYGRGTGKLYPVDMHVGVRLRQLRTLLGMTQTKLGEALGINYQQVQKFEQGENRMFASRLYGLSRVLDVPVEYFFEDIPPEVAASSPAKGRGGAKEPVSSDDDLMATRETLELVRAYYKIEDADVRQRMHQMITTLGWPRARKARRP